MKKELWVIVLAVIVIILLGSAIYMDSVSVNEYIETSENNLHDTIDSGDVFQSGDLYSGENDSSGDIYKSMDNYSDFVL